MDYLECASDEYATRVTFVYGRREYITGVSASWDDRQKMEDFNLARFADQTGASGRDNTGTLPFMGLDLLLEKGLHGEIPRYYRRKAESLVGDLWSIEPIRSPESSYKILTPSPDI